MKYSIGDRVKIVEDGWGCCDRIGETGTIIGIEGNNHELRMDDGSRLDYIWREGFVLLCDDESSSAIYLLKQMYEAVKYLPNKDWLDPSLERAVKEFFGGSQMKECQKYSPKYWMGHHKQSDDVMLFSASKSRKDCLKLMEEAYGEDWLLDDDFDVILVEIKQVAL